MFGGRLLWGLWFGHLVGALGTGLFTVLAGSAGGADSLWSAQFVGRLLGVAALADTGGFVDDILISVMQCGRPLGRCPFLLGGGGGALITAQIPGFSLGHVGGAACSGWWCRLPLVPVGFHWYLVK